MTPPVAMSIKAIQLRPGKEVGSPFGMFRLVDLELLPAYDCKTPSRSTHSEFTLMQSFLQEWLKWQAQHCQLQCVQ